MTASERAYRVLLLAYPRSFRGRFASEMIIAFHDLHDAAGTQRLRFWLETLWDIARSAPHQRADSWRRRRTTPTTTENRTMKPMAFIAILIGALEGLNALAEAWAGGVGNHDPRSLAAGALALIGGALLIAAGSALLRSTPAAERRARLTALGCLGLFAATIATQRISILSILLGITIPIALLLVMRGARPPRSEVLS